MRFLLVAAAALAALAVDMSHYRGQDSRSLEAAEASSEEMFEVQGPGFSDHPSGDDAPRGMKVPRIVKSLSELHPSKAKSPAGPPLWARSAVSATLKAISAGNGDWDFEVNTCGCTSDDLKWLAEPPAPSTSPTASPTPDPHKPFPLSGGLISFDDYYFKGRTSKDIQESILGLRLARVQLENRLKSTLQREMEQAEAQAKVTNGEQPPSAGMSLVTVPVPPTYTKCRCGDVFPRDWLTAHMLDLELAGLQGSGIVNAGSNPVAEARTMYVTTEAEKGAIGAPDAPVAQALNKAAQKIDAPIASPAAAAVAAVSASPSAGALSPSPSAPAPAAPAPVSPVPSFVPPALPPAAVPEISVKPEAASELTTTSAGTGGVATGAVVDGASAARFRAVNTQSTGMSQAEKAFAETLASILAPVHSSSSAASVPAPAAGAHPAVHEAASAMRFAQAAHEMMGAATVHGAEIAHEAAHALHAMTAVPLDSDAATHEAQAQAMGTEVVLLETGTGSSAGAEAEAEAQPWGDLVRAYTQGSGRLAPALADGNAVPGIPHSLANPYIAASTIAQLSPPVTSGDIQAAIARIDDLLRRLHTAQAAKAAKEAGDMESHNALKAELKGQLRGSGKEGGSPTPSPAPPSATPSIGSSPWYDLSSKAKPELRLVLHSEGSAGAAKQIASLRAAAAASKKRVIAAAKARAQAAQIGVNRMRRYAAAVAQAAAHQAAVAHEQLAVDMGALRERVAVAALASEITARSEAEKARIQLAAVKALLAHQGKHAAVMQALAKKKAAAVHSLQGLVEGAMKRRTKALEEAAAMRAELDHLLDHAQPSSLPTPGQFTYDAMQGFVAAPAEKVATPTPSPTATPTPFFSLPSQSPAAPRARIQKVVRGS